VRSAAATAARRGSTTIVTVATAAGALHHGRTLLGVAARVGAWLRTAGVVGFVLALAGVIPNVTLSVRLDTLGSVVTGPVGALPMPSLRAVLW